MKRLIVAKILIMGFLFVPAAAYAGFFDDGRPYMASDQWTPYEENGSGTALTDADNRLNWLSDGWNDGHEAFRCYYSQWQFDLDQDFEFQVGYHHGHAGTFIGDDAYIMAGLVSFHPEEGDTEPSYGFSIEAFNNYRTNPPRSKNLYTFYEFGPNGSEELDRERNFNEGVFYAVYSAASDVLELQVWEDGVFYASEDYSGLKSSRGLDELRVYLGGSTSGAELGLGETYLENFQMNVGNGVVPEPLSLSLFLLGAGVVVLRNRRRVIK